MLRLYHYDLRMAAGFMSVYALVGLVSIRQPQHGANLIFRGTIEHRRGQWHPFDQVSPKIDDLFVEPIPRDRIGQPR